MITPDKMAKMAKDLTAVIKWVEEQECKVDMPSADESIDTVALADRITILEKMVDTLESKVGDPGKKRKSVCVRIADLEKAAK